MVLEGIPVYLDIAGMQQSGLFFINSNTGNTPSTLFSGLPFLSFSVFKILPSMKEKDRLSGIFREHQSCKIALEALYIYFFKRKLS